MNELAERLAAKEAERRSALTGETFRPGAKRSYPLSELGNAERFVDSFGERVRYCAKFRKFFVWDDTRWRQDETEQVFDLGAQVARGLLTEAMATDVKEGDRWKALLRWAIRSESRNTIAHSLEQARASRRLAITPDDLDRDPWLFNTANGTLDLQTGEIRPHAQSDLLTQISPVRFDQAAEAPRWIQFLQEIFLGDQELIDFIQRAVGYALSGSVSEQVMLVHHGLGANGKSVFFSILQALFGDYAIRSPFDALTVSRNEGPRNEIARMKGKRLVLASEGEYGARLAQAVVKDLTGGETVAARFLYGEYFEFQPTAKLFLATNHKPKIQGNDFAIWRRLRLVPYGATFPKDDPRCDPHLTEKLMAELPGILAWAVRGCIAWQEHGLGAPEAVAVATSDYRSEEDSLGEFLAERCRLDPGAAVSKKELYAAYLEWAEGSNTRPLGKTNFVRNLEGHGIQRTLRNGLAFLKGLDLRAGGPFIETDKKVSFSGDFRKVSHARAYEKVSGNGVKRTLLPENPTENGSPVSTNLEKGPVVETNGGDNDVLII